MPFTEMGKVGEELFLPPLQATSGGDLEFHLRHGKFEMPRRCHNSYSLLSA